jgi:hypothetical protein
MTATNTLETMRARIAELEAQVEETKAPKSYKLKVSQKGCVSLYNVRKLPVTFYRNEWETIFAEAERIKAFIEAHKDELAVKE